VSTAFYTLAMSGEYAPMPTLAAILTRPEHDVFVRRERMADRLHTQIEPGADPRAQWDDGENPRSTRGLSADEDDAGYSPHWAKEFRKARMRYPRNERRSLFEADDGPSGGLSWASETYADSDRYQSLRYVPRDVVRWRDPAHRAALTERARAYAALQPGARR